MNGNDDAWTDEQLAALLAAESDEGPLPTDDFFSRLREESAAAFAASQVTTRQRRSTMLFYASRIAASAIAATAAWFFASGPASNDPDLGQVLDKLAAAGTLHLRVKIDDKSSDAWVKRPGQLRWNLSDGTYQIARGDRLWVIDEKANRAVLRPATCFRGEKQALDVLGFLLAANVTGGMDDKWRDATRAAKPISLETRDGVECAIYKVTAPSPKGDLKIDAVVDRHTGLLRSLESRIGQKGKFSSLAAVDVLAVDPPVAEDLFVVGDTLTEDGRIGKITDAQGVCAARPAMAERWTPMTEASLVMPGDWLRTDLHGANAMAVRLVGETRLTVGPGSLVELVSPKKIRVNSGDMKVVARKKSPVEVAGPDGQVVTVTGTQLFRIDNNRLVRLTADPLWLKGFEGQTAGESIGSLVANIDGRNTPLSVGYHKVTVDIRDQIARTVVEESFVNHTSTRLEGVFHFPLPADASISGFGMWIGSELVEADMVEKQRAREIYETILRERRDPGLLEWAGGNIFKARVFPIEAHSEKRVKITYTQVLPRQGNGYRYSYALQSELLRQHPLRELLVDVKINSVMPLTHVASPTHPVRVEQTAHSARVEFAAQEYTPTRDFEVAVEVGGPRSELTLIPHRRGDDGYFLTLLTPPAFENASPRGMLPAGEPIDLLILADTSASLNRAARTAQREFVATLLGSLTPKDRINLAACDVACDWTFAQSMPAEPKNLDAVHEFLDKRVSLGWTDLDKAFASAFSKAGPKTRIVYIGDGIVTTGDADPVAFAKRLRKAYEGKAGTCYAISVGSSYETAVLKAIASCGGGAVRQIGGQQRPTVVARELLDEMAKPALKDLKIEFRGLQVARVYPEELPNLPAGGQQVILGRYLPAGKDQSGEVVVAGTFDGRPIRYASRVSLADAEQGNSFIPRLWARMHLDDLLRQGASQTIQDEIIALSEEYNIMTPYTSLLVLETDADRERFKVKRQFAMRDGERFFAEGRDNANYELLQQQMRRAGLWRVGLRQSVLAQLSGLGRDASVFAEGNMWAAAHESCFAARSAGGSPVYHRTAGPASGPSSSFSMGFARGGIMDDVRINGSGPLMFGVGGNSDAGLVGSVVLDETKAQLQLGRGRRAKMERWEDRQPVVFGDAFSIVGSDSKQWAAKTAMGRETTSLMMMVEPRIVIQEEEEEKIGIGTETTTDQDRESLFAMSGPTAFIGNSISTENYDGYLSLGRLRGNLGGRGISMRGPGRWGDKPIAFSTDACNYPYYYNNWLAELFLYLPAPPHAVTNVEPKKPWPADAKAVAASLLRTPQFAQLQGGMQIQRQCDAFEPRFAEQTARSRTLALVSPSSWLMRTENSGSQTMLNWCDKHERGAIGLAMQLGRLRTSQPSDLELRAIGLGLEGAMLAPLDQSYRETDVELKPQGENRVLLRITYPTDRGTETSMLIDTARHVVLSCEYRREGKVAQTVKHDDFVEVAGAWWPGRVETFDAKGRRTALTTQTYAVLTPNTFAAEIQKQLAVRDRVQFLQDPLPKLLDAKRALAAGKASFDDQIVLLDHFAQSQQWPRVMEHLASAEKLVADKPGIRWLRDAVLKFSRRHEELKMRGKVEAERLAKSQPDADTLFLADRLMNSGMLEANERMRLLDLLKPAYEQQPALTQAMRRWRQQRVNCLQQTGRNQEAFELLKQLVADYPHDVGLLQQYTGALIQAGEDETALRLLREAMAGTIERQPYEHESLRSVYCQRMQERGRWSELADFLNEWLKRDPEMSTPYEEYLGVLVRLDKLDDANAKAAQWLAEGRTLEKLSPPRTARLQAAVGFMLGNCRGISMNRIDDRWLRPLGDAAIFLAQHETQGYLADQIMTEGRFTRTDECRRVRKAVIDMLASPTGVASGRPAEIQRLVRWGLSNDPAVEPAVWRQIAQELRKRWDAETKPEVRRQIAQPLVQILSTRLTPNEWLAFLRVQWQSSTAENRAGDAKQLFEALIGRPWSQAYEDEAFGLLEALSEGQKDADARLCIQVAALHQLTDRMLAARYQAKVKAIEHPEKLTRIESRAKQVENRKAACEGFADRLHAEMAKREGPIVDWLNTERLYCDVMAGRNLDRAAEACWESLGPKPKPPADEDGPRAALDRIRQMRSVMMLANLAARKNAPPQAAERLLKYIDAGIAMAEKDDLSWQTMKYQLLVALDRPQELERALREWIAADGPVNRWRLSLGYLLAEQGKLAEAITMFETVAATDELGPADYQTLADWYMAVGRRDAYERAKIAVYKTVDEWRLRNWLSEKQQVWQRNDGHVPTELDPDVLLVTTALLEKATHVDNHLWTVMQLYRECHDFRLLACLADSITGRTAGQVYPMLRSMSSVLHEIRDEATADALVEQLAKVRRRAKNDVDRRACDLLEVLVERRAAEIKNQPGPHGTKALAALQRAFKREWTPGEPRLMADFLAALGQISHEPLAAEQVRELETLCQRTAPQTIDRLHIGRRLAESRWAYGKQDAAIDLLQLELAEYQRANGGKLPMGANDALGALVSYFEQRRHFARGEDVLLEQAKHPCNAEQTRWLMQRLYELYSNAIRNDGDVSLGRGQTLLRAAAAKIEADMATGMPDHRYQLLNRLCDIYRAAHEKKLPAATDDLRAFALERFPSLVKHDLNNYTSMVQQLADTVHNIDGPRDGLAFLIGQVEREPRWLRYSNCGNRGGWHQFGWMFTQWSKEVRDHGGLGDLDSRLLKIVLAELREDLETQQSSHNSIYRRDNTQYWREKEDDFARVAEEVYQRRKTSRATIAYVAQYLFDGLGRRDRGIEMLLIAQRENRLDDSAQKQLVEYLHRQQRFGESIAVLLPLVERRPDVMQYRVLLLRAYFSTKQPAQLQALVKQTDEHFRKDGRWTENNLASLAASCLDNELFAESVKYYRELIPMYQRSRTSGGIGDEVLSRSYRKLALAHVRLKNTSEAVEAACSAIVSWGPRADRRDESLATLREVLQQSADLDAYVRELDKKTADTGLHNPLVRAALGQVYLDRGKIDQAIAQLSLAVELQPGDVVPRKALLTCYDRRGDREGGVPQLLGAIELAPRDIELYKDLARRYCELGRSADAERAVTSIVEMLPNESESHATLAEIRQSQNRWNDAIHQWRQVARLRALEPTGLLKLANAQVHERLWDDAEATLRQLQARSWPSRFQSVQNDVWQLQQKIEQGRRAK
jgi:tetratricopeptide (TPR) repeat protein